MKTNADQDQQSIVAHAVDAGITRYIASRKSKIPNFVSEHFSMKGAMRLHKNALGKDLYKAPLNILWSVPSIILRASGSLLRKLGAQKLSAQLDKIPSVLETEVQKQVNWLIYTELLEIPYVEDQRSSDNDALLGEILSDEMLSGQLSQYLSTIHDKANNPVFRRTLEKNLDEYATSRTAASDLAGSIVTLSAGFATFNKTIAGTLTAGSATASAIAQHIAMSNFWLGSTLGSWYYGVFPTTASTGLLVVTTGTLMAALAIITLFSGIITDPLQAKLGIHEKRLLKFIDALEGELSGTKRSDYKLKDQYLARVFDILDLLKTASKVVA